MLFDFETKESAECFVGYVSKNENFFQLQRKYKIFVNIDMHVQTWAGPGNSRRTRLPEFKTIVT